ncbi:hypothetical protein [Rhodanobacter lindaniclasticus]
MATASGDSKDRLREQLAMHFVQRRRPDIDESRDSGVFPQREIAEITYRLTGHWDSFFQDVLDYCRDVTQRAGDDERRQRLSFWGTLALMRCVASSPAAAVQALNTRLRTEQIDNAPEEVLGPLFDGAEDNLAGDDVVPAADTGDPACTRCWSKPRHWPARKVTPSCVCSSPTSSSLSMTVSTRWCSAAISPPRTTYTNT